MGRQGAGIYCIFYLNHKLTAFWMSLFWLLLVIFKKKKRPQVSNRNLRHQFCGSASATLSDVMMSELVQPVFHLAVQPSWNIFAAHDGSFTSRRFVWKTFYCCCRLFRQIELLFPVICRWGHLLLWTQAQFEKVFYLSSCLQQGAELQS